MVIGPGEWDESQMKTGTGEETKRVYRDSAVSDRVAESDALGFDTYVSVLARFLRHERTKGPLTVSVEGPWGSGKSTLMRFLADELSEDAHTVWFNAWRHDEDSSMWAAFMLEFLQQVSADETTVERLNRSLQQLKYRVDSREELLRLTISTALVVGFVVLFPTYVNAIGQSVLRSVFGAESGLIAATSTVGSLAVSTAAVGWLLLQFRTRLVDPLERSLEQYSVEGEYEERTSFVERFHSDFEQILRDYVGDQRVYVFVDDLDRCALPRAAELMQSINLMIGESENVYFVLGMDRDKVAASIAKRYEGLVPYLATVETEPSQAKSEYDRGVWYGNRFIEKFVQVPLEVPRPTEEELRTFVGSITGATTAGASLSNDPADGKGDDEGDADDTEFLEEDTAELQVIAQMVAPALADNPRRIKMFVNLFRVRKMLAHELGVLAAEDQSAAVDSSESTAVTSVQLGKFVAIGLRWPRLLQHLERDESLLAELYQYANYERWAELSAEAHWWTSNRELMRLLFATVDDDQVRYDLAHVDPPSSLESVDVDLLLTVSPPLTHGSEKRSDEAEWRLRMIAAHLHGDRSAVGEILARGETSGLTREESRVFRTAEDHYRWWLWVSENEFVTLSKPIRRQLASVLDSLERVRNADSDTERVRRLHHLDEQLTGAWKTVEERLRAEKFGTPAA